MNCKPGDLAVIVRNSRWMGWIVEVVSHAPHEPFIAPDGTRFGRDVESNDWLIRAPRPFGRKPFTNCCYATVPDNSLRPLRGLDDDEADEMLHPLPKEVEA